MGSATYGGGSFITALTRVPCVEESITMGALAVDPGAGKEAGEVEATLVEELAEDSGLAKPGGG